MISAIFLLATIAMVLAVRGQRTLAIGLFALTLIASALWLGHHMTDHLNLAL